MFVRFFFCSLALLCTFILCANNSSPNSQTSTTFKSITPPADIRAKNGADTLVALDFIYWSAFQDGLGFARYGITTPLNALNDTPPEQGTTIFPPKRYNPGFKVTLGVNLEHDGWDTLLQYTWIQYDHKNRKDVTMSSIHALRPLWDAGNVDNNFASLLNPNLVGYNIAEGSWRFRFNNFDLELGRNFFISSYLKLRPHFGLKGCWYRQDYKVLYQDSTSSNPPIISFDSILLKFDQNFWGVGIRAGSDSSFQLTKNWSIFNELALSLLWARFNVVRQDFLQNDATTGHLNIIQQSVKTNQDFHTIKPTIETMLGLRFDAWLFKEQLHLAISAAWEEQIWINQNQLFKLFSNNNGSGDLTLQGLTLTVRLDF